MKELPDKDLLRPEEVAEYLSVSVKTIYGWIDIGKINAVRIAGSKVLRIERKVAEKLILPAT